METNTEKKEIGYTSAQEYIKTMEEKHKKEELEIRNKILIHLGVVDKEKSYREYRPYYVNKECKWDDEVCKYYIEKPVPLEVSDEEYQKILKYAEAEIEKDEEKPKKGAYWGDAIATIAWIVLILTIISCIFIFIASEFDLTACLLIISAIPSFCILMGFAKIVSAAEKYLSKQD